MKTSGRVSEVPAVLTRVSPLQTPCLAAPAGPTASVLGAVLTLGAAGSEAVAGTSPRTPPAGGDGGRVALF